MVALGRAAAVALRRRFRRRSVHHRRVVVGVAHPQGGQLGQHRFPARARLRGQPSAQPGHAVGLLVAEDQPARPRPVFVAVAAVGVEAVHQPAGQLGQLIRPELCCLGRQLPFGVLAGLDVHRLRQLVEELPDHRHVVGADRPVALGRRRGGQQRRQRLAGQRPARAQVGRLGDPATRVAASDVQPLGQRERQPAAEFGGIRLLGKLVDQLVPGRAQPARLAFEDLQQPQPLRRGQRVIRMPEHAGDRGAQRVDVRPDLLPSARMHVRNTTAGLRQKPPRWEHRDECGASDFAPGAAGAPGTAAAAGVLTYFCS
ncbi:hypothetical protein PICSAR104_04107 [Mycobacterium avium subsp. paratuberculosis]|nr:hypothetical protein PICSAR103_03881 [Mycobacterium avium subsp. paratuberculosis]CAG6930564.1 hypothetical protein PICSAR104_04107 [Mycobacterium avium subsp. paratuberculosis]CAG7012431.1 hypothetical protein PICSAR14_03885 [Mycobacterium avium subsp. paratuberculosis]CAG7231649.1 hypothetical protein PICSAR29_02901 [Mycobacterium avium subsp. paratuberculosis]CAG7234499.1 hypothetical protein PICSAR26_02530 [Mycobacterium avium subsp. paratuberculosis]